MKKFTVLMASLLLLSVGFLAWANPWINRAADQVTFTADTLYGDPSAAEGAVVDTSIQYDQYLFWDSVSHLGASDPETETDYRFYSGGHSEIRQRTPRGISFSIDVSQSWPPLEAPASLAEYARQLWEATPVGEEGVLSIPLREYTDIYPLSFSLDVSEEWGALLWGADYTWVGPEEVVVPGTQEYLIRTFQQFFRIPVAEEARAELQLYRTSDNPEDSNLYLDQDPSADYYYPSTYSALAADACFFTFSTRSQEGRLVDTSLIPGGYGLYRAPYGDSWEAPVQAEELAMVYPLDPEVEIIALETDEEKERLVLITREEDTLMATVISCRTYETLQRFPVMTPERDALIQCAVWNDLLLLRDGSQLALVGREEDGDYALLLTGQELPEAALYGDLRLDWDGERLAVVRPLDGSLDRYSYSFNFLLAVYDREGLAYAGSYVSSLQQQGTGNLSRLCNLTALDVRWEA